jgi:hypothetical protein
VERITTDIENGVFYVETKHEDIQIKRVGQDAILSQVEIIREFLINRYGELRIYEIEPRVECKCASCKNQCKDLGTESYFCAEEINSKPERVLYLELVDMSKDFGKVCSNQPIIVSKTLEDAEPALTIKQEEANEKKGDEK